MTAGITTSADRHARKTDVRENRKHTRVSKASYSIRTGKPRKRCGQERKRSEAGARAEAIERKSLDGEDNELSGESGRLMTGKSETGREASESTGASAEDEIESLNDKGNAEKKATRKKLKESQNDKSELKREVMNEYNNN
jgi:hypothetical protein